MEQGKESLDDLYKDWETKKDDLKKILEDLVKDRPDGDWKTEMIEFLDTISEQEETVKELLDDSFSSKTPNDEIQEAQNRLRIYLKSNTRQLEILINHYKDYPEDLYENKQHMKQVQKLNNLINRIIKEEMSRSKSEESSESSKMDEDKVEYTPDGTPKTASSTQKQDAMKTKAGETVSYKKPGQMQEEDENTEGADEYTQDMDHVDKDGEQDDLAARALAEAAGQMKGIVEAPKDAKHAKHAAKVLKHVEAANEALGHLRGHEKMILAKENDKDNKEGEKHLKAIEKHLGKVVKDKDAVGKMMKKMPIEKVIALKKAKGGELDEEKVAKALLKHVIKEGAFGKTNESYVNQVGQHFDIEVTSKRGDGSIQKYELKNVKLVNANGRVFEMPSGTTVVLSPSDKYTSTKVGDSSEESTK